MNLLPATIFISNLVDIWLVWKSKPLANHTLYHINKGGGGRGGGQRGVMLEMNFFETFQKVAKPIKIKRQTQKVMRDTEIKLQLAPFAPVIPLKGEK